MNVSSVTRNKKDKLQIKSSTADFLVFTKDFDEDRIDVRVQDDDV